MPSLFRYDGLLLVAHVQQATGYMERARGLIGVKTLEADQALALTPCGAIHTCWMRFELDLIFLARNGRITKMIAALKPWRIAWGGIAAWRAIEMRSGWFDWNKIKDGDRLLIGRNAEDAHALSEMRPSA